MKRLFICLLFLMFLCDAFAQKHSSFVYTSHDSGDLSMDVYMPADKAKSKACFIFVHGGGFSAGDRMQDSVFLNNMRAENFTVISIDYRLGMKGVSKVGVFNSDPVENAIKVAVEDLYAAVNYTIGHTKEFGVDADKIVLCGSSAGAITVLQADYYLANGMELSKVLPEGFHFAGVISFSGAIFSHEGAVDYVKSKPAPTMMLHGMKDKLVPYSQMRLFKKGMFGSASLVKRFEKFEYPYKLVRYVGLGHEVASLMPSNIETINSFIDDYVLQKKFLQIDETINDPSIPHFYTDGFNPSDLYKNEEKK